MHAQIFCGLQHGTVCCGRMLDEIDGSVEERSVSSCALSCVRFALWKASRRLVWCLTLRCGSGREVLPECNHVLVIAASSD